jgi:hypothetical protein
VHVEFERAITGARVEPPRIVAASVNERPAVLR